MRVRFTESVAGVYFSHWRGQEMDVGEGAGELAPAQADAWLASGTVVEIPEEPAVMETASRSVGEHAARAGRGRSR